MTDMDTTYDPIKVHVTRDDTRIHPIRDRTSSFRTYQGVVGVPDTLVSHAPNRKEAVISVLGVVGAQANVVLCDSQGQANNATGTGEGSGTVLQPGMSIRIHNTDVIWFVPLSASYPVPAQPAVPASTVAQQNPNAYPVTVVVTGGTATVTTVNGITVGAGDGTYVVPPYGSIAVTYSVAPTWAWTNANGVGVIPAGLVSVHQIFQRA